MSKERGEGGGFQKLFLGKGNEIEMAARDGGGVKRTNVSKSIRRGGRKEERIWRSKVTQV